jgi:hypothetical protein
VTRINGYEVSLARGLGLEIIYNIPPLTGGGVCYYRYTTGIPWAKEHVATLGSYISQTYSPIAWLPDDGDFCVEASTGKVEICKGRRWQEYNPEEVKEKPTVPTCTHERIVNLSFNEACPKFGCAKCGSYKEDIDKQATKVRGFESSSPDIDNWTVNPAGVWRVIQWP